MKIYLIFVVIFGAKVPAIEYYWWNFNDFCRELRAKKQNKLILKNINQSKNHADPEKGSIIIITPTKEQAKCKLAKVNADGSWDDYTLKGIGFEDWLSSIPYLVQFREYGPTNKDKIRALLGIGEFVQQPVNAKIYLDCIAVKVVKFDEKYGLWRYESDSLVELRDAIITQIKQFIESQSGYIYSQHDKQLYKLDQANYHAIKRIIANDMNEDLSCNLDLYLATQTRTGTTTFKLGPDIQAKIES